MKRAVGILLVLLAVLGGLLYWKLQQQRLAELGPTTGSGIVEGSEVYIMSKLMGRVEAVSFQEGRKVRKGEVLVRLDCSDYEAVLDQAEARLAAAGAAARAAELAARGTAKQVGLAASAVAAAKAQRRAAEVEKRVVGRTAERLQKVRSAGAVSDQSLDQTKGKLEGLSYRVAALAAQIKAARYRTASARAAKKAAFERFKAAAGQVEVAKAALHRAQLAVAECVIRAPAEGYVEVRGVEPGEVVMPGARLGVIVDISEVKARFYVPNRELGAVSVGGKVEVRADAYPHRTFDGRIDWISKEAEFTPRNVQTRKDRDRLVYAVEVRIPNSKGLLRPGMPVDVTLAPSGGSGSAGRGR